MREYWLILKQQIRQRLGLSLIRHNFTDRKGGAKAILIALVVFVGIVSVEGSIVTGEFFLIRALSRVSMSYIALFLGMVVTMVATLISGAAFLLGVLYFGKDAEALSVLPARTRSVFGAKMTVAYLGELGVSAAIVWPIMILVGIFDRMGAFYYVKAFVVWLAAISLPLTLAALVSLPLMRFTALWKRREVFAIVGGIALMLLFVLGQSYLSARMAAVVQDNPEQLVLLLFGNTKLFERIANTIPPLRFSLNALMLHGMPGLYNLLALLLVSAALLCVTLILSQKLYRGGVSAQLETYRSGRETEWGRARLRENTPLKAVFTRELKTLLRTPIYALNALAPMLVFPIMLLIPRFTTSMMQDKDMQALVHLLEGLTDKYVIAMIMGGVVSLFAGVNAAISTAVSREGKQFFWIKALPVAYREHITGKFLLGVAISAVAAILGAVCGVIGLRLPPGVMLLGLAPGLIMCVPICALQLMVDAVKPKLVWANPTEAIKQNMNLIIGMVITTLLVAALGFLGYFLLKAGMPPSALYMLIFALSIIISVGSVWWMNKAAQRALSVIEP